MRIGNLQLRNNLIQAPLAGFTDLPFRLLAREMGAGLAVSEMVSSEGIVRHGGKSLALVETCPEEQPLAVQLFGARPEVMAEAAQRVCDLGADLVDINMGCPVRKVVRTGAGAALLKDLKAAEAILQAVVQASQVPVTVKIRAGWDSEGNQAVALARIGEACGVAAIAVHARTRAQGFDGQADWRVIAAVKAAVGIPVVGNGDVRTAEDVQRMLAETGCDGVMIGRAGIGYPWIFREAEMLLCSGRIDGPPTLEERRRVLLRHLDLSVGLRGEPTGVVLLRKVAPGYVKGLPGSSSLRKRLNTVTTASQFREAVEMYFDDLACAVDH